MGKFKGLILLFMLALIQVSCLDLSKKSFRKVPPSITGIRFLNQLIENDTLNYTIFPYMYMGGGVSVGDINNDGLDDIFFTGNLVPNKLYLNTGNMRFKDISSDAGIEGSGQWFTGSTMADVNNDGWLDIYLCVSAKYPPTRNLLFINNGDNTFSEEAEQYGIDDRSSSVQATFFDYNNDGLIDLYVANYPIVLVTMGPTYYHEKMRENNYYESGHLYRNNGDGNFSCVTREAGVQNFGMSIGIVAMDFNNDGWKDLYISNDFNVPDYFYLNNRDGTFRDVVREATFQTSIFGMGLDAADINNDGYIDLFQIDMTPEDHYRAMVNVAPMSQQTFDLSLEYGFHYQYMHNTLQINNGIFDHIPVYSNISILAGLAYTDWSWGGLFADLDNDGSKDLFVSNGVLKDINNRDALAVSSNRIYFREQKEYTPDLYESTPLKNYAFRNNADLTFDDKTDSWGFDERTLSNGFAYGDFDNDGDLDLVISHVNAISAVYENRVVSKKHHYLKIGMKGPLSNPFGLGSVVSARTGNVRQTQELTLSRGYQSSVPPYIHVGTGQHTMVDELTITWPDGKEETLFNVDADQTLVMNYTEAKFRESTDTTHFPVFKDITASRGIDFLHREDDYVDYQYEPLLPHLNSRMGPGLAVGDVNGDGLDDFYIGNAKGSPGQMFLQEENGRFVKLPGPWEKDSVFEDTGALLFDANGDGKMDLYVVSGGNEAQAERGFYRDRLYLNSDNGFFSSPESLPEELDQSGKCVRAADYDQDGDLDLFVGGRLNPGKYPAPADSYLLENNGKVGSEVRFENVTPDKAPEFVELGMVTDAVWYDFNWDGTPDLIVVGEWMNICFFENNRGVFNEVTNKLGFEETVGWWFSIQPGDVDGDGDEDLIVGNLGLNYRYQSTEDEHFDIFLNDFNLDGKQDIVMAYSEEGRNLPLKGLNASSRQIPVLRMRFEGHEHFASSTLEEIYGEQMLDASLHYRVNTFAHQWIENRGRNGFKMHRLPNRAQISSVNDVVSVNYNGEGPAFIVAGNLYNSEAETPRNDASVGLVLQMDSAGALNAIPPSESSLMIRGEVKVIERIGLVSGNEGLLFGINNDSIRLYEAVQVGEI
jgi:hypothetical protein